MKNHQRLKGLLAATFTPMDANGNLNLAVVEEYAQYILKTGMTGVFVGGTSGEFPSLTTEERKMLLEEWLKQVKGKMKVIAHVGSDSQRTASELARHAQEKGADGIAAASPYFFKPASEDDLINFFIPVAEAASHLPFYYYHMPVLNGVKMSVPVFLEKGKTAIPTLCGVKFTHFDVMEMGECLQLDNGSFEIFNGYDEILLAGAAYGADSGVGSTYNYFPEAYQGILEAMQKGDLLTARKFQMKSIELIRIVIKYGGGVRGGKAIMNVKGIPCGPCRLPISPLGEDENNQLKSDLKKIGFI